MLRVAYDKDTMSRLCALNGLLCRVVLATILCGGAARADSGLDPLPEMRAAAEAAADLDPDSPRQRTALALPVRKPLTTPLTILERSTLLREAVRAEIDKEAHRLGKGDATTGQKAGKAAGPFEGSGASEEARGAAARAQEARRNREVAAERGQSTGAPGRLKQESNVPEKSTGRKLGG